MCPSMPQMQDAVVEARAQLLAETKAELCEQLGVPAPRNIEHSAHGTPCGEGILGEKAVPMSGQ